MLWNKNYPITGGINVAFFFGKIEEEEMVEEEEEEDNDTEWIDEVSSFALILKIL